MLRSPSRGSPIDERVIAGPAANAARICYIHAGTHKTGTTSLQRSLTANREVLAEAGIFVPRAGRVDSGSGHHNLAWQLCADPRFAPEAGTISDFLTEIRAGVSPTVCVSSEDFEYAAARPGVLRAFADLVRSAGFEPVAVVYVRPQADYAESLYAELVKHGLARTFGEFFDDVVTTGCIRFREQWCFDFDYERLLGAFAAEFGPRGLIVRRYDARLIDVVDNFFALIGAASCSGDPRFIKPERLNGSIGFEEVLRALERNVRPDGTGLADMIGSPAPGRFDPVHLYEAARIVRRFNAGNRRILTRYGIRVPCVSGRDLVDDVRAAVGADPASRYRQAVTAAAARCDSRRPRGARRQMLRRIQTRLASSAFGRPARLELVTVLTAMLVAIVSLAFGQQTTRTSLVEFGMLSMVAAASAAVTTLRYIVEAQGFVSDEPFFKRCGVLLRSAAFTAIGLYAAVNAGLDVLLARHDPDWISYPGACACAVAAVVFTLLMPAKQRLLGYVAASLAPRSFRFERRYLRCVYVAVACEVLHAFEPAWWVDTSIDIVVALFAVQSIAELPRRASAERYG